MEPRSGLWLVADGMGGHDAGEIASSSIVDHLATLGIASSAPDLRARFEDRLDSANAEIRGSRKRAGVTIGSTVAALLAFDRQFACIWSGDSRVYLVRERRDHADLARSHGGAGTARPRHHHRGGSTCLAAPQCHHARRRREDEIATDFEHGQSSAGRHVRALHGRPDRPCHGCGDPSAATGRCRAADGLRRIARHGAGARRHRQCHRHVVSMPTMRSRLPIRRPLCDDGPEGRWPSTTKRAVAGARERGGRVRSSAAHTNSTSASPPAAWARSFAATTSRPATPWRSRSCCRSSRATR